MALREKYNVTIENEGDKNCPCYYCTAIVNGKKIWARYHDYTRTVVLRMFTKYCDNVANGICEAV
jgi:hypothetical protein